MYDLILISSTMICFIIASIMDIRKREIADYISGFLILFAGIIRFLWFFTTWEIGAIFPMIVIAPATFGISYLIYKKNMWGGGDVKLISAASIAITGFSSGIFFFEFLFNLLFAGAFYGIVYSIGIVVKNRRRVSKKTKKRIKITLPLFLTIIAVATYFYMTIETEMIKQLLFFTSLLALIGIAFPFAKEAEAKFFYKRRSPEQLTEGDWLAEDIKKYDKVLIKNKTTLEKKHLELIKKLKLKEVLIKEGIPFVPSFLIALIITTINPTLFLGLLGI